MKTRPTALLGPLLLAGLFGFATALGMERPPFDAGAAPVGPPGGTSRSSRLTAGADPHRLRPGRPVHEDTLRGVPSFLWAGKRGHDVGAELSRAGASPEAAARRHLAEYGDFYRLDLGDAASAPLGRIHDIGRGPIIVSFRQSLGGVEIFRDEIRLLMDRDLNLLAISGAITGRRELDSLTGFVEGGREGRFSGRRAIGAVAIALSDLTGSQFQPDDLREAGAAPGGHRLIEARDPRGSEGRESLLEPARARQVWFRTRQRLEPAWYVELSAGRADAVDSDIYAYVIGDDDGRILFRHDLTVSDLFTYRVWADSTGVMTPHDGPQGPAPTPHPTGLADGYQAPFTSPALVSLQNGPISTNDPWLPPGAAATTGNNADAFADIVSPDGFSSGDLRATTTSPGVFDRVYNTSLAGSASADQRMAAVTQLFYDVNFLHDWFYDAGFDEVSGNAQSNNYGRGGLAGDSMRAEAQDFSGRNNANMSTPSDGGRPRMQMYLFDGIGPRGLTVSAPAAVAGAYPVGTAAFGPQVFNASGVLAGVDDGSTAGTGGSVTDACQTPFSNAAQIAGKIALIDRGGGCSFTIKVKNAQLNGAVAALIANNVSGIVNMSGSEASVIIPALSITQTDGAAIRAQLGAGVAATLSRSSAVERDGTIDNQIVAHEWGHYISNRLIGNAAGLSNIQGGGMGEGWGDFHAMLLSVRPEDALAPGGAGFTGVYAMAGYVRSGAPNGPEPNQGYYFGIRRVPYSIDFSKNPLTFQHIESGVPLPGGVPIAFGADGSNNAEVHSSGEVWATMLWECYAALLRDDGRLSFDEARRRMTEYLVAGYKMTPSAPTFLEARDAILVAALAADPADFALFSQAFARRGAGVRAIAPDRHSATNAGVVESYSSGGDLTIESAVLDDDIVWCDRDGLLDDGETGTLRLTMRNSGSTALSSTVATVSSANPRVGFPDGASVAVPASSPFTTAMAEIPIHLSGSMAMEDLGLEVSVTDPGFAIPGPVTTRLFVRGHLDELASASTADDVESGLPSWIAGSVPPAGPADGWRRVAVSGFDHRWFAPDPGGPYDLTLVSPELQVGSDPLSFTFLHKHVFEAGGTTYYDGGVLEISTNGGSTWSDIGSAASPGYGGTIATGGLNPIGGRPAFVGTSLGTPDLELVTVSLGTSYAGQTVRIRFRLGSDAAVGAPGWEIDDIVFTGLTNLPFPALSPESGVCIDSDVDGVTDLTDCAPLDATLWSAPGPAADLDATGTPTTVLSWLPPLAAGAAAPTYDLLRSGLPQFAGPVCLVSDATGLMGSDPTTPGSVYFYLVRVRTGCGESLGSGSSGIPRSAPACP